MLKILKHRQKQNIMKKSILILLLFSSVLIFSCIKPNNKSNFGTVIEVPNEINTIQEAIKNAYPFDTILIHPGEYFEYDLVINKPLYITSEYLTSADSLIIKQTIINGNQISRVIFISNESDTIKINGLTITGGFAKDQQGLDSPENYDWYGGGLFISQAKVKLSNIVITENTAAEPTSRGSGGGLYIFESFVSINLAKIDDNYALQTGGAFLCENSTLIIHDSDIKNNRSSWGGPPISIWNSETNLKNVQMHDNLNEFNNSYYPEIGLFTCTGLFENVIVTSDSIKIEESQIIFINCDIPGF